MANRVVMAPVTRIRADEPAGDVSGIAVCEEGSNIVAQVWHVGRAKPIPRPCQIEYQSVHSSSLWHSIAESANIRVMTDLDRSH